MNVETILVDLDGTLAEYHGMTGLDQIGAPIATMVARVKQWLAEGKQVKIFTARMDSTRSKSKLEASKYWIEKWCLEHIGVALPVTCEKGLDVAEIWDDRAKQVYANTGRSLEESIWELEERINDLELANQWLQNAAPSLEDLGIDPATVLDDRVTLDESDVEYEQFYEETE